MGRELLAQAKAAGYWTRAQSRTMGQYTALAAAAHDVVIADATNGLTLEGIARDIDIVGVVPGRSGGGGAQREAFVPRD